MTLDIPVQKTNTRQEAPSFLGPKINHSHITKNKPHYKKCKTSKTWQYCAHKTRSFNDDWVNHWIFSVFTEHSVIFKGQCKTNFYNEYVIVSCILCNMLGIVSLKQ